MIKFFIKTLITFAGSGSLRKVLAVSVRVDASSGEAESLQVQTCPVIWIIGQIVNARFPDVRAQYSDASKRM
uniref:hypothetical protein n=1 Tax=Novacetimonas labruscae TaxID=3229898 RepID=UPI003B5AEB36